MSNRGRHRVWWLWPDRAFLAVWGGMGAKEDDKHNGDNQLHSIDELHDCNVKEYRIRSGRTCQQWQALLGAGCAGVRG